MGILGMIGGDGNNRNQNYNRTENRNNETERRMYAQKATAYCLPFKSVDLKQTSYDSHNLIIEELDKALHTLIKLAQQEEFPHEIHALQNKVPLKNNSNLLSLLPLIDDQGIIRVGDRGLFELPAMTPLSNDPNDFYLSLKVRGRIITSDSSVRGSNQNCVRLNRYHRLQQLFQHFWSRWIHEYLNQLQQRSTWKGSTNNNVKVDTLVILKDENRFPLHWPVTRIVELHPGLDQVVRVVSVKVPSGGVYKSTLAKICILPLDNFLDNPLKLAKEFNSCCGDSYHDAQVLRNKYLNMKKRSKKNFSEEKKYLYGTEGSSPKSYTTTDIDNSIKEIIGSQITGLSSEFDNDQENMDKDCEGDSKKHKDSENENSSASGSDDGSYPLNNIENEPPNDNLIDPEIIEREGDFPMNEKELTRKRKRCPEK
ncbi:hypothetical protein NQ314_008059 [Rhamnusium bicolor]|uniref:DUF5641 domain-containing protein n=1 Tax=Rhamnusium bicolor TaxID=1586634 RepID=A0AAV8YHV8_9CUCU|nr:hypothetical protein NQ314_008059 [Rhamnusium bicolor]